MAGLLLRPAIRGRFWTITSTVLATAWVGSFGATAADRSIVLPLDLHEHFPLVTVDIDGDPVPLEFDSGNPGTVSLAQAVIDRVKAAPTGETSKGMDAKGHVIEFPKYRIPRIQIGSAVFIDVIAELDVHDASYPASQVGQQGFFGTALLKSYRVVLDYPHRRITLIPPRVALGHSAGCRGTVVPFSSNWHGEPATEVDTDLGRLVAWWDTGSPALVLSKRFAREAGSRVTEGAVTTQRLTLGGTDFGPAKFEIWDVALPPGFDGFIGYHFFATHVVCMDFPGKRLLIPH